MVTVSTDATWRSTVAEDIARHKGPNGFRIDAKIEPVGWQDVDFDDSGWHGCVAGAPMQRPTIISELAPPLEAIVPPAGTERATSGVTTSDAKGGATFSRDGGYAIHYPRVLSATIVVTVRGHAGARLLIMANEPDAPGYNRRAEILLREGRQTFELPFIDGFSTINLEARGVKEAVAVDEVRAIFTSYPVRYAGSFDCDRPELTRLWKVCRWVTQICMQSHYLDSPDHQEPICDPGDYLIESLNGLYAFGDGSLARQDLRKFARILEQRHYQNFHTSYALLWLQMLRQYYDYTGDASLPLELAPIVHGLLDRFEAYVGKNGLISNAPNYMFMDWVEIAGFNAHHPPAVIGQGYMTALFYRALADNRRIAVLQGDPRRADHDDQLRAAVKVAFNRELWNDERGLYRDGKPNQTEVPPNQWLPADRAVETFSTQVNSLAVCVGLTAADRSREIMRAVVARPDMNCQPYFMHFVFEALAAGGLFDEYALPQMSRWHILPDTQSFFEMWNQGDRSHAWQATPLFQMSGRILGVLPVEPGFRTFAVAPHPAGLRWARGDVPTPAGTVGVEWHRDGREIIVSLEVPRGARALCGGHLYASGKHSGIRLAF